MKLTKQQRKLHDEALEVLNYPGPLSFSDREVVYNNLRPEATTDIGRGGAFFTPWEIASDFQIETLNVYGRPKKVLDLCAGYGILSMRGFERSLWNGQGLEDQVTCLEINPEYIEIGRKLFPEAEWIQGDVFDAATILAGRQFDEFYSNPPFGSIPKGIADSRKKHRRWEYAIAEIGMSLAECGTMIVMQGAPDWKYSDRQGFERFDNPAYSAWSEESGLVLDNNCGIDCSHTPFASTGVTVEIANVRRAEKPSTLF